jgi:hypothetical protein
MKVKLNYGNSLSKKKKKTVLEDNNSSPTSITKQCFQCKKGKVIIRWNKPKKKYSEKNNLGYYTERREDKEKWLCEKCIFQLYYQKKSTYWQLVPNLKKRQILRSYIYLKSLEIKG